MPGPDAVDHDPCGQGVFPVHDPVGESETALALPCGEKASFHIPERFRGTQGNRNNRLAMRINITAGIDDVRVEIALGPCVLRHGQASLNVFHCNGLAGKNGVRDWLNTIQFNAVTDEVLGNSRLGRLVPGIKSVVPHLGLAALRLFQTGDLLGKFLFLFLIGGNLGLHQLGESTKTLLGLGRKKGRLAFRELSGREDCHHSVIVTGWHGIEFVVVALGALHGMGEEGLPHRIGHVVEPKLTGFLKDAHARLLPRTHAQEPGGHEVLGISWFHLVSRHLFLDELVIRLVLIKGTHHVITVAPGIGPCIIIRKAPGISVSGNVQPMPREMFAVMGRRHQLFGVNQESIL